MGEDDVLRVLKSFFDAMGKWEADSKALYRRAEREDLDYETVKAQSLSELRQVFDKYCTQCDLPARARYGAPHVSMIPTYGAQLEDVLSTEIKGDRAVVITRQNVGPKFTLRYNFLKLEGGWRIEDNRKIIQPDGRENDWDL